MPLRVSPRAGSPPPMRGKGHNRKAEKGGLRITPAYAGKSCRNRGTDCNIWDHPRLCGEKQAKHGKKIINPGSPPPMRGKGMHTTKASPDQRITPAYAGKRTGLICKYPLVRDPPRLCGEKDRANKKMHVVQGSPPPMRGKEVIKATKNLPARITPAYAGKSFYA